MYCNRGKSKSLQNTGLCNWDVAVWEQRWGSFRVCLAKRYVEWATLKRKWKKKWNYKRARTQSTWRLYFGFAALWFLEHLNRKRRRRGRRENRTMRGKQRKREADMSKVGTLGEHLIIIYIRSVSPSPQDESSGEQDTHMLMHINNEWIKPTHMQTSTNAYFHKQSHPHSNTHGHAHMRPIMNLGPDCVCVSVVPHQVSILKSCKPIPDSLSLPLSHCIFASQFHPSSWRVFRSHTVGSLITQSGG